MTFATELTAAAGTLTAAQIATATGASKRTVENWRHGRNVPLARYQADILKRVRRASAKAEKS
jgi:transcriptional regulator with XRE-family HTH domain